MILTDSQTEALKLALQGHDVAIKAGRGAGATTALGHVAAGLMRARPGIVVFLVAPVCRMVVS